MLILVLLLFAAFFVVSGIFITLEAIRRNESGGLKAQPKMLERRLDPVAAIGQRAIPNRN